MRTRALVAFLMAAGWAVAGQCIPPVGVYISSSGLESKRLELFTDKRYVATWATDIGSNGEALGTWSAADGRITLIPEKETDMMVSYLRVLVMTDYEGRPALVRKEDEEHRGNPYFLLFVQKPNGNAPAEAKERSLSHAVRRLPSLPNQSLEPMARTVTPRADARVAPILAMAHH